MSADNPQWNWTQSTVLVVEDDPASRELLTRRLARDGLNTLAAADGPSALAVLAQQPVSAVLLDIGLPAMSGLDVLRTLRQTHPADLLPVLMVTAFDETERLEEAFDCGASDYLNKPIHYPAVRARLKMHLERAHAARALLQARERETLMLQATNDGIWDWDSTSQRLHHSNNWFELLGWGNQPAPDTIDGWMARIHPDDQSETRQSFERFVSDPDQTRLKLQYRLRGGDDDFRWIETRGAAVRDALGQCLRLVGSHTDISALRYVNRVTQLPNLQRLIDRLDTHLQRLRDDPQGRVGVLVAQVLDIDHQLEFASGQTFGKAIEIMAETLYGRLGDRVQIGSGEQASQIVLLARDPHVDDAALETLARSLHDILQGGVTVLGKAIFPRLCVGVFAEAATHAQTRQSLAAAQLAARVAQENARPTLRFDTQVLQAEDRRKRVLGWLRDAIEDGPIEPWWQPILCANGVLAGFEALARWRGPDGQAISPAEFIPLAQSSGLIAALTDRILQRSLAALAQWRAEGLVAETAYTSVNFPPSALLDPAFPQYLSAAVASHDLPPSALCVEVTESDAAAPGEPMERITTKLRRLGFRLAIDDFGTGYSSLASLNRLAFETVKIDQSFVRGMMEQPRLHEMIRAIVGMARALGLRLVAEGVETQEQAQALGREGVDRMQGYLYARPMPEPDLRQWLQNRRVG
ncbi:EAL domain-containing protein [Thiomonas bhubaneswarensis]|uniref:EAL domain, c-di-GMP-specific phosphodiesterase class I (Or its enzymatically inactive variant) n=1 Tax=Thiomonas bhubaneswarensis TaxID=339866 RepID=A0A0K6HRA6_9BURK|nr:EAL domain-containing protein [Thiomonas bhubaneswarensis]CUA93308.1 EAL domain, c-di-GMP-specific phosphodiesterase class I (or its enzymatically inactive variant) [Thiomonas bhubaneswarensis]